MNKHRVLFSCGMFLVLCLTISIPGHTADLNTFKAGSEEPKPQNTVILANEMDARFSQDFSPLLKHMRLNWVVLESSKLPDTIKDKNIILVGHPDEGFVGEVMREFLTEKEIVQIRDVEDQYILYEIQSIWNDSRKIFICSGTNFLLRRNAVETLARQLIDDVPQASDWVRTAYDFKEGDGFHDYISQLQYQWDDSELPLEDLLIDLKAKSPWIITSKQAVEDVDRLFYLFSHGYSGYAFFNQNREFERTKSIIIEALNSKAFWTRRGLSKLIRENLSFIVDCHLNINNERFAAHQDFWYDTQLELVPGNDGYYFIEDNIKYSPVTINGNVPGDFLFPSLNQAGEPIYRIGMLSKENPSTLTLIAQNDEGEQQFDVKLQQSNFDYYDDEVFRQDVLGGIPVIRIRGFGDSDPDDLERFVATAKSHRGDPVVIVDIRGNGGGNERWPIGWIKGLTGYRAGAVFTTSELESKTSMAGRVNAFIYWDSIVSDPALYNSQAKLFTERAERFEVGQRQPGWTGPQYPDLPLISNDTTVLIITNDLVASAGEGFVMRMSQAENVLVVGENTMGCLTFGNISLHQLPNSKLEVWMPINFNIFQDQVFREEVGLFPDLWVPAKDAVNYTVAALRQGTITTSQPLPEEMLAYEFKPESDWRRIFEMSTRSWIVLGAFTFLGSIWANALRKKTPVLLVIGVGWIAFSIYWISHRSEKFIGYGFGLTGAIWIALGGINLIKRWLVSGSSD